MKKTGRLSNRGRFDYHFISREPMPGSVRHIRKLDPLSTQYVICDGEGSIVKRVPVHGSLDDQSAKALLLLLMYAAMDPYRAAWTRLRPYRKTRS